MAARRVRLLLHQMESAFGTSGWVVTYGRALDGLTAAQASWLPGADGQSPVVGANSIWQMINHLAFWKEIITRRIHGAPLAGPRIRNQDTFGLADNPRDEASWQAAVQRLYSAHEALMKAVASLHDAQLDQPLPGESTPLGSILAELNLHDTYHLGQILLTRKLQGLWKDRE